MIRIAAAFAATCLACSSGAPPGPENPVEVRPSIDAGVEVVEPVPAPEPPPPSAITDELLEREPPPPAPTQTLARGVKLYESGDFHAAHLAFHTLLTEELPSAENRQRGELFMAKAIARLGFHVPAYTLFARIAKQGDEHAYARVAVTWLVWLVPHVWFAAGGVSLALVDDPEVAAFADELRYRLAASALSRGAIADAAQLVEDIDRASPYHAAASLDLATTLWQVGKSDSAIDVLIEVTAQGELGAKASMVRGSALLRRHRYEEAIAAYEQAASYRSQYVDDAVFAVSAARLARDGKLGSLADSGVDWLVQIAYFDYCLRGPGADAFGQLRGQAASVVAELADFATRYDDPAEQYDAVRDVLGGGGTMSDRARFFVELVIDMDTPAEMFAFAAELEAEMALLLGQDDAYRASAAAAELQQEIALNMSLAQTDAGRVAAELIELIAHEIEDLARDTEGVVIPTLDEPGDGFTMMKGACLDPAPPPAPAPTPATTP